MAMRWPTMAGLAAAVAVPLALPETALALDDANPTGLITDTVASRQRTQDFDNAKPHGTRSVRERIGQDYNPIGIRAGNFIISPSAETKAIYHDNIFASPDDPVADLRTEIAPMLEIKSSLPRHILNFAFGGRFVSFAENSDQNYLDGFANASGALHVDHAHTLALAASTELVHQERSALNASQFARDPVPIHQTKISGGLTRDVGRLYGTLSATAELYDYYDVDSILGGTLDQDIYDTELYSTQLRAGYRFSPGFEAVTKLRVLRKLANESGANNTTATGYEALFGVSFETSPILRWRILGGYGIRDYDDASKETAGTSLFEGRVDWLATERMTVSGTVSREFSDLSGEDFSGWVQTTAKATVDYEIHNDLFLKFGVGLANAGFSGSDRDDQTYSGEIGLEYYMNKNWLFTFSYEYSERQSSDDRFDLTDNKFLIGAKLRF
ncbi:MAG: outer membrane beta-barrel protein [Alphaproteobacteria bacterium]|nr:outer membrane beta-barrel protein [Alphaproteobacteria bacterium]